MNINIREIQGPWTLGYSLDKHTISSTFLGNDENGRARFDTKRYEVGEALYLLKYGADLTQADIIATQMVASLGGYFGTASFVIPMPASKARPVQPVVEIAKLVAAKMNIPCLQNILVKHQNTPQMKDIPDRDSRVAALCAAFNIQDNLAIGLYDVLIIDDLYDTGSSLEAATLTLKKYNKIRNIFVATATRRK